VIRYSVQISATQVISDGLTPDAFDALYDRISSTNVTSATATTIDWITADDLGSQYGESLKNAAFALTAGQVISQPVELYGAWYLGKLTGRETRDLSEASLQAKIDENFQTWLTAQATRVTRKDYWVDRVPAIPRRRCSRGMTRSGSGDQAAGIGQQQQPRGYIFCGMCPFLCRHACPACASVALEPEHPVGSASNSCR